MESFSTKKFCRCMDSSIVLFGGNTELLEWLVYRHLPFLSDLDRAQPPTSSTSLLRLPSHTMNGTANDSVYEDATL
jgi:hypothetical protein